jgi:type IV pilus assembly protein PilQ
MTKIQVFRIVFTVLLAVSTFTFAQQPLRTVGGVARYNQSGDRIVDYFDIHAADIRSVLRQISAYSGVDIINSDAVKATVTLTVSNKSWREILTIVCMVHGLAFVEEQGFIYVMGREEAAKRGITVTGGAVAPGTSPSVAATPGFAPIMEERIESLIPLMREVIPLRYTTAAEMSEALTPFLSERGKLTAIKHTNAIIVVDTDEYLKQVKGLLQQIDIQTAQISISCKIIEVSSGVMQNMGMNWNYSYTNPETQTRHNIGLGARGENPNDNGALQSTLQTLTYGLLSPDKFQLTFEYLFQDNKAEIVAQPQITTLNNKEAKIFMGQQIPINTKDEGGNTITEMVSTGTQLTVTPYVSGDGKIMLTLNPSKESYELIPDSPPIINRQSAHTTVLVNNGETVVIAGLTSNEKIENEAGIPILKNIPIIGNFFKRSAKSANKRDLIIFVTPHIIHPGI